MIIAAALVEDIPIVSGDAHFKKLRRTQSHLLGTCLPSTVSGCSTLRLTDKYHCSTSDTARKTDLAARKVIRSDEIYGRRSFSRSKTFARSASIQRVKLPTTGSSANRWYVPYTVK